ncbi:exodeoxyribonuclease VII large subunit [Moraxella marmotae]|uniref:exodeoxyribonuclease VII large subunit n=1 Tax=Moraxella marmotae TaxID=3344520 RepID=UPI0035F2E208
MPKNTIVERAAALGLSTSDEQAIMDKHRKIAEAYERERKQADDLTDANASLAGVQLSLSDYLAAVKLVVDDSFDHEVWVRTQIRAINTKGGHYYFELAETDDDDNITASCRATLWRFRAKSVLAKFTARTGQSLQAGSSVLIRCSASFHPQYGFSLNISDIDPNYTLGELAAAYQAMKKRLDDEGLLSLNKNKPMPFDIRHVVVISPEQAAGLGDFRAEADRLMTAKACQFYYHHATFQGNHAPDEIRTAISTGLSDFITNYGHLPDLLVIIRGGGAVGDLAYLNNYELAALIAECPVPVWVGVGHERDKVILDEVAHSSFDTPSKVVLGIETHLGKITRQAAAVMDTIGKLAKAKLSHANQNSRRQLERIYSSSNHTIALAKRDNLYQIKHLQSSAKYRYQQQRQKNTALLKQTQAISQSRLTELKKRSKYHFDCHRQLFNYLDNLKNNCRYLQSMILVQHPKRTLSQGYAIIYNGDDNDKHAIGLAKNLYSQQHIQIKLQDGTAAAIIQAVSLDE